MAIKITTWRPDTCNCVIHYSWDDSVIAEQQVYTPLDEVTDLNGKVIPRFVCSEHVGVDTGKGKCKEHYSKIVLENQTKNKVLKEILYNNVNLQRKTTNDNGEEVIEYKKICEPKWSFDKDRNLIIKMDTNNFLTKTDKTKISEDINKIFKKVSII